MRGAFREALAQSPREKQSWVEDLRVPAVPGSNILVP